MNTREQFGNYLLLKKLTEDPLGETFRACVLGDKGMERVALLRIFNGQGLDGQRLWAQVKDRQGVQQVLRSPNVGEGIDLGEIQSIPYVAYEYVSGKNMAVLLEQAAKKRNFVPAEHALLITERVALALAAACETRYGGERILHGFLVPQLTFISNEGETRLLGFEVAQGLRSFAANPVVRQHFGRYLSPETLAGAPGDRADDIYSLGVFLFELLTGRPLPPPGAGGYGAVIDKGVLANEGEPIPEELRDLLKKSLVARTERLNDVAAWHKTLSTWMFEGQYNPTTFNLAFFMHNLFRQEIERESQEIEVERTLPVPVQKPAPAAAAAPTAAPPQEGTQPGVASEATENFIPEYAREDSKSKIPMFLGIAVVVVLLAAVGYFWWSARQGAQEPSPQQVAGPPPTPVVEEPKGPTEEEIRLQIADLVEAETSGMEEKFRAEYEQQLKDLENQLGEAKKAAERRRQLEQQKAEEEAARLAEQQKAEEAAARLAEQQKAEEEAARLAEQQKAEEEAARLAAATPPPPVPTTVVPTPPPAKPAQPQVRRGDLITMGPGVKPPEVLRVQTRFPEMARRANKLGATVEVKVLIDENGKPHDAELVGKPAGFGFDTEALQAIKKGSFRPATKNGVPVKMWYTISVVFKP